MNLLTRLSIAAIVISTLLISGCVTANQSRQTAEPSEQELSGTSETGEQAMSVAPELPENPASKPSSGFVLNEHGYFQNRGVGVMPFLDTSPESHQGGIIIVSHGNRIATNGDLRLEATPGQWSPVPVQKSRVVDTGNQCVVTSLTYPDSSQHLTGFNPLYYPDIHINYKVTVSAVDDGIRVKVDLDRPLPPEWIGKVGFILELYPYDLFGKSWIMDNDGGIFPREPVGAGVTPECRPDPEIVPSGDLRTYMPLPNHCGRSLPLASGKILTVAPESDEIRLQIETLHGVLELHDQRVQHQNGWFIVRSTVAEGADDGAIEWIIRPNVIRGWIYEPVLQYSMVGYHPAQEKIAVIETDPNDDTEFEVELIRLDAGGRHEVISSGIPELWGDFLRYSYFHFDFSDVTEEGMYQLVLGEQKSEVFRISEDVFDRNVWQPVLDYFLPVQMAHMRVKEKYRLWHDASHLDDALMAPVGINHFDGYVQGPSTLTGFQPLEHVPGLNRGGWFDAGDDDLRIESQSGEVFILSAAFDEFGVMRDNTLIDQELRLTEIREPDGKPDILQQIEHGLLTVVGGYQALGRLYRGIIVPTLTQYVMGGDFSGQTDNLIYDPALDLYERTATHSGLPDDRWVFTEENPSREFGAIANIAAGSVPMRGYNDEMAGDALQAAVELWNAEREVRGGTRIGKIRAAVELFRATGDDEYRSHILNNRALIIENFRSVGWSVARVVHQLNDQELSDAMRNAAAAYYTEIEASMNDTPYGLSFEMQLWGRGWTLQSLGVQHYFLHKAFPDVFGREYLLNIIHFILGKQPGSNNQSYASGVGARSKTSSYGLNRMDYSYIPGGVIVGTALIQPDFPELKEFPYLWQQSEYVLGGGSGNFMFLVLAAHHLLNEEQGTNSEGR
jgi:endoglucanase